MGLPNLRCSLGLAHQVDLNLHFIFLHFYSLLGDAKLPSCQDLIPIQTVSPHNYLITPHLPVAFITLEEFLNLIPFTALLSIFKSGLLFSAVDSKVVSPSNLLILLYYPSFQYCFEKYWKSLNFYCCSNLPVLVIQVYYS